MEMRYALILEKDEEMMQVHERVTKFREALKK